MSLEEDRWVRAIGEEVYNYVGKRANDRDDRDVKFQRDLIDVHRQGWKNTADAILKGFGLVADAIRDHGRH